MSLLNEEYESYRNNVRLKDYGNKGIQLRECLINALVHNINLTTFDQNQDFSELEAKVAKKIQGNRELYNISLTRQIPKSADIRDFETYNIYCSRLFTHYLLQGNRAQAEHYAKLAEIFSCERALGKPIRAELIRKNISRVEQLIHNSLEDINKLREKRNRKPLVLNQ